MGKSHGWMDSLSPSASANEAFQHWLIQQSKMNLRGPANVAEAAWLAALEWNRKNHGVSSLSPVNCHEPIGWLIYTKETTGPVYHHGSAKPIPEWNGYPAYRIEPVYAHGEVKQ